MHENYGLYSHPTLGCPVTRRRSPQPRPRPAACHSYSLEPRREAPVLRSAIYMKLNYSTLVIAARGPEFTGKETRFQEKKKHGRETVLSIIASLLCLQRRQKLRPNPILEQLPPLLATVLGFLSFGVRGKPILIK